MSLTFNQKISGINGVIIKKKSLIKKYKINKRFDLQLLLYKLLK